LNALALARFKQPDLRALTLAVYAGTLARDGLARFAEDVQAAAASGDEIARAILDEGCCALARMVQVVAQKLGLAAPLVSGIGGVWRGALARELFGAHLRIVMPAAQIIKPLLGPAAGALLLAYRAVQIELNHALLAGWEKQGGNELGRY
jgi:N-acetylglucosamine kinase-like BadF-type ATPase